ncbi:MAG: benzoate-CoA ligase family protein [Acidobacteriota bacterium]
MNLVEYVFKTVKAQDLWEKPAILCENGQLTYQELLNSLKRHGRLVQSLGVKAGECVAIVAQDCREFIISFLGTVAVGSVVVPISTMLSATELEYILNHCAAKVLILTYDQVEKIQNIKNRLPNLETILLIDGNSDGMRSYHTALSEVEEGEIKAVEDTALAFILYTSGSTGQPKGAMHIHRNLPYTVETYCKQVLQVSPLDRLFSSSRLFFAYGLGNSLSFPLSSAATVILCQQRPTPALIVDLIKKYRPTIFFAVPAVYRALIEYANQTESLDTTSIRLCISAGEKLPERIFYEWQQLTELDILDGIGSTEMLQMFISNRKAQIKPGSSGLVVPGYQAKIVDPEGNEVLGPGSGNLLIKGLSASPGYWQNPAKTASTMLGEWMFTGDIYYRDENEYYWFSGRSDDMFKVKGLWVSPVEVEDVLLSYPDILEVAVVPEKDPDGMNRIAAYLVLKSKQPPEDNFVEKLKAHLSTMLPVYKFPTEIYFIDQLPRTATGKIQRFKLKDKA